MQIYILNHFIYNIENLCGAFTTREMAEKERDRLYELCLAADGEDITNRLGEEIYVPSDDHKWKIEDCFEIIETTLIES